MALSQAMAAVEEANIDELLRTLVHEHARFVFKVAYSVLRNHQDAEDAAQETFLRVMRHRRELTGIRDARAWLARIAWRIAVDRRRNSTALGGATGNEDIVLAELRAPAGDAEQAVISTQMLVIAERLIEGLPRELRDVLMLAAIGEMSSAEIAGVLGIAEASVRTRLFRARRLLKEKMSCWLEGKTI